MALGEVGKVGVAIDSIEDMERLFAGIKLDNDLHVDDHQRHGGHPACALHCGRQEAGRDVRKLSGTVQNDILKEYIARGTYIYPPRQAMRLVTDIFAYAAQECPSGTPSPSPATTCAKPDRTAVQEVAFTLFDGMTYVQAALDAGLDIDGFAPRLSFFFASHKTSSRR